MAITQDPVQIVEVKDGRALIRMDRMALCVNCHLTDWLYFSSLVELWVDGSSDARAGDFVQVEMKSGNFLLGIFVLYVLPVIGLLAGVLLGQAYRGAAGAVAGGFGGLALSFALVHLFDRFVGEKAGFRPKVKKVVRLWEDLLTPDLRK